mmetsp:Transcript_14570/g.58187  ORF Transcript_14570/g.58187 Transcript_14570/m.58187 type:complete len:95 (+) Transcript_14570:1657-1941(+)
MSSAMGSSLGVIARPPTTTNPSSVAHDDASLSSYAEASSRVSKIIGDGCGAGEVVGCEAEKPSTAVENDGAHTLRGVPQTAHRTKRTLAAVSWT